MSYSQLYVLSDAKRGLLLLKQGRPVCALSIRLAYYPLYIQTEHQKLLKNYQLFTFQSILYV